MWYLFIERNSESESQTGNSGSEDNGLLGSATPKDHHHAGKIHVSGSTPAANGPSSGLNSSSSAAGINGSHERPSTPSKESRSGGVMPSSGSIGKKNQHKKARHRW